MAVLLVMMDCLFCGVGMFWSQAFYGLGIGGGGVKKNVLFFIYAQLFRLSLNERCSSNLKMYCVCRAWCMDGQFVGFFLGDKRNSVILIQRRQDIFVTKMIKIQHAIQAILFVQKIKNAQGKLWWMAGQQFAVQIYAPPNFSESSFQKL